MRPSLPDDCPPNYWDLDCPTRGGGLYPFPQPEIPYLPTWPPVDLTPIDCPPNDDWGGIDPLPTPDDPLPIDPGFIIRNPPDDIDWVIHPYPLDPTLPPGEIPTLPWMPPYARCPGAGIVVPPCLDPRDPVHCPPPCPTDLHPPLVGGGGSLVGGGGGGGIGGGPGCGSPAVPEPASLALVALAATAAVTRRRI